MRNRLYTLALFLLLPVPGFTQSADDAMPLSSDWKTDGNGHNLWNAAGSSLFEFHEGGQFRANGIVGSASASSAIFYATGTTTSGGFVNGTVQWNERSSDLWGTADHVISDGQIAASAGIFASTAGVTSATEVFTLKSLASADTDLTHTMGGLELLAAAMTTSAKYTPAIKFMSYDGQFTSVNPKWLAGIIGRAAESYVGDTDGGMDIDFLTFPINGGATTLPSVRMTITSEGNVGIGKTNPSQALDVAGNIYAVSDVSALSFTDRTDSPKDATAAINMLRSMKPKARGDGTYGIDYSQLVADLIVEMTKDATVRHIRNVKTGVISEIEITTPIEAFDPKSIPVDCVVEDVTKDVVEPGRNLTMTVSALSLAVPQQDTEIVSLKAQVAALMARVDELEKNKVPDLDVRVKGLEGR